MLTLDIREQSIIDLTVFHTVTETTTTTTEPTREIAGPLVGGVVGVLLLVLIVVIVVIFLLWNRKRSKYNTNKASCRGTYNENMAYDDVCINTESGSVVLPRDNINYSKINLLCIALCIAVYNTISKKCTNRYCHGELW